MFLSVLSLLLMPTASADSTGLPPAAVTGLVQTWVTALDQDERAVADPGSYGDPEDDAGFKLRRVRLGLEGKSDAVRYGITVGAAAPFDVVAETQGASFDLGLVDTYGGYSPAAGLWITGGLQKVPVSREALTASSNLALIDRAVSTHWLTPGRDLGAVVDYRWNQVRARLGAFNGGGDLTGDDNEGKLYAGRVEFKTGDGAVYRTFGTVDGFTFGVAVDGWVNSEPAVASQAFGVDLIIREGGLAVLAEGRMVKAKPKEEIDRVPGVFAETTRQGAMVQIGYTVRRFEPVVRYSLLDDNVDSENGGDVSEVMSGATWHGKADAVRAGIGYALRTELGPNTMQNDTLRAWLQLKI